MDTALDLCTTTRQLAVVRDLTSLSIIARQAYRTAVGQITTAAARAQAPTAAYDSAIQQQHAIHLAERSALIVARCPSDAGIAETVRRLTDTYVSRRTGSDRLLARYAADRVVLVVTAALDRAAEAEFAASSGHGE